MSFSNVGKVYTPKSLKEELKNVTPPSWCKAITLHHAAEPSLAQRPNGLTIQHIKNIESFYQAKGWHAGPHFFVDEDQVFGMSPYTETGIHAVSFNKMAIGIELLGDYDSEDPFNGRGAQVWANAIELVKVLVEWLGLKVNEKTILFHRDDPKTSKTCPGTKIKKDWVLSLLNHTSQPIVETTQPLFIPVQLDIVENNETKTSKIARLYTDKVFVPIRDFLLLIGDSPGNLDKDLVLKKGIYYYKKEQLDDVLLDNSINKLFVGLRELLAFTNYTIDKVDLHKKIVVVVTK